MGNEPTTLGSTSAMTGECRTVDPHGQKFWRVNELADKLGVNAKWLGNRIDRGQIASQKLGAMRVIAQAEAQRLIDLNERGELERGTSAQSGVAVTAKPAKKTVKKAVSAKQTVRKMVKHAERVLEKLQAGDAEPMPSTAISPAFIQVNPQALAETMNLFVSLVSEFKKIGLRIGLTAIRTNVIASYMQVTGSNLILSNRLEIAAWANGVCTSTVPIFSDVKVGEFAAP